MLDKNKAQICCSERTYGNGILLDCLLKFKLRQCHESGCHSLQLHITHGLHLPSCTALTHSHPPLHQSHSCHHSLISLDCLTAPHSHTHTHLSSTLTCTHREVLFLPRLTFLSVIHPAISVFDPGLPDLGTLNLCL